MARPKPRLNSACTHFHPHHKLPSKLSILAPEVRMIRILGTVLLAAAIGVSPFAQTGSTVNITVELGRKQGPYKPIYAWFGYDEANFTTMRDGKNLLRTLHALSPVPVQIRAHHLFSSGDGVAALKWSSTNIYSEDAQGRPVYDFRIFDAIFDEYKAAGVTPMVELGFTPKAMTSGPQ